MTGEYFFVKDPSEIEEAFDFSKAVPKDLIRKNLFENAFKEFSYYKPIKSSVLEEIFTELKKVQV